MTEVFIPFSPEMVDAVERGDKICTSRYKKYGDIGDITPIGDKRYRIIGVIQPRLQTVSDLLFGAEGFTSNTEFENFWVKLHPKRGWRPDDRVYTHFFEEVR